MGAKLRSDLRGLREQVLESKEGLGVMVLLVAAAFLFSGWLWPTGFRNEETPR